MFLNQKSIPLVLFSFYQNIPAFYRQIFWIIFIVLNVVFGFHTVHFIFGNHDWYSIFEGLGLLSNLHMGKYTEFLISLGIQNGRIMPFLNNELGFLGLSFSAILFCSFFQLQKEKWMWLIVSFLFTLQPFVYARMYYVHQFSGVFIAQFILFLGFVLSKQAALFENKIKSYFYCFLSSLCIHWALATYPLFIDTILIVLTFYLMVLFLNQNNNLKNVFHQSRFIIIAVILGVISFKLTYSLLKDLNIVMSYYNNQLVESTQILPRIVLAFQTALHSLTHYETAFMPRTITLLFFLFFLGSVFLVFLVRLPILNKIFIFVLFFFLLLFSQTHIIISKNILSYSGIEYHGLMFLRVLLVVLFLKLSFQIQWGKILIQNGAFLLSILILWVCVIHDLHAQRAQKLAMDAEFRRFNRIIDRIEQTPGFSYSKQFCGIMFGDLENIRVRFHKGGALKDLPNYNDYPLVGAGIMPPWNPLDTFDFLMEKSILRECNFYMDFNKTSFEAIQADLKYKDIIQKLYQNGVLNQLKPWPDQNSVVIVDNILVFTAGEGNLKLIQNYAQQTWGKKN